MGTVTSNIATTRLRFMSRVTTRAPSFSAGGAWIFAMLVVCASSSVRADASTTNSELITPADKEPTTKTDEAAKADPATKTGPASGHDDNGAFVDDAAAELAWVSRAVGVKVGRALVTRLHAHALAHPSGKNVVAEARALYWLGLQQEDEGHDKAARTTTYASCTDVAKRAQSVDSKHAGGFYYEAVCRAKTAEIEGAMQSAWLLPTLQKLLEASYNRDPNYADGGADRFWGTVISRTPGLMLTLQGSSLDDGAAFFVKSQASAPDLATTMIRHAELQQRMGNTEKARALLQKAAIATSTNPDIEAWNRYERPKAKAELKKLNGK